MRISDWSSDVCSSDLPKPPGRWLAPYQTPDGQMNALTGHQAVNRRSREYEQFGPASLRAACHSRTSEDRKRVVSGKRVSVSVDLGGSRIISKNTAQTQDTRLLTAPIRPPVDTTTNP